MSETVDALVAPLRAAVDGLLAGSLSGLSDVDVPELAGRLEIERRRLAAVDHRVIGELTGRQVAGLYGGCSVADLLVRLVRIAPAEAKARVRQAGDLGPRSNLQGGALPPILPATASAVQAGEVSTEHVDVITRAMGQVPASAPLSVHEIVETTLVEAARHEHPRQLGRTAHLLVSRLDPDGLEPQLREQERKRDVTLTLLPDGSGRFRGWLTPEVAAKWTAIFDALSAPRDADDQRTAAQRRHDGLGEAGDRLLRSGDLPPAGGTPVTVLVRTTADDLATATASGETSRDTSGGARRGSGQSGRGAGGGIGLTDRGAVWSIRDLLASCSDAVIVPVVTDQHGAPLWLGRSERLANRAQRLALHVRDGGCSFPGCDRPAPWTEVHHVIPWQYGGPTDLDNLTLVCRFHHREFERQGWQVRITDGIAEWIPPPWVDPQQQARRNTSHHPPELEFAVLPGAA